MGGGSQSLLAAQAAWQSSEWLSGLLDEGGEVFGVPSRPFSAVFQAEGRLCLPQQVQRHVLDHGHVRGAVAHPELGQVVVEHHIEHPMQAVLNPPMAAHHAGKGFGIELGRAEIVGSEGPSLRKRTVRNENTGEILPISSEKS